jgi:hypothetical protein
MRLHSFHLPHIQDSRSRDRFEIAVTLAAVAVIVLSLIGGARLLVSLLQA